MYPSTILLSVPTDGPALLAQALPALQKQGWQVVQSFDLQTARQAHAGCACPHHGTNQCNCQLAVFLIYGAASGPLTLIAHGRDGRTELSLVDDPNSLVDLRLLNRIRQVFKQPESPADVHPAVEL